MANVPQADMESRLLATDRTERGMWAGFLRAHADTQGRPIMGEKTPAHLAYVDTILEWFPTGRVVHMIRDPRGVDVSEVRRRPIEPRNPYSWFGNVPGLLPLLVCPDDLVLAQRGATPRRRNRYPDRYRLFASGMSCASPTKHSAACSTS